MSRQVDHETTVQWTCDICGMRDLCSYSKIVTPTAPEGWVWLLTFRHDREPRIESDYGGGYSIDYKKRKIPLPDGTNELNPNVICQLCAKKLKAIVKDTNARPPDPPKQDLELISKVGRLRVAAKFGVAMTFAFLLAAAVITALLMAR